MAKPHCPDFDALLDTLEAICDTLEDEEGYVSVHKVAEAYFEAQTLCDACLDRLLAPYRSCCRGHALEQCMKAELMDETSTKILPE